MHSLRDWRNITLYSGTLISVIITIIKLIDGFRLAEYTFLFMCSLLLVSTVILST